MNIFLLDWVGRRSVGVSYDLGLVLAEGAGESWSLVLAFLYYPFICFPEKLVTIVL